MKKCNRRGRFKERTNNFSTNLTRNDAIGVIINETAKNPASKYARKLIFLFGITAEELSESGMTYEVLRSLDGILH